MNLNSKEGTAGITALLVIAIVFAVNFLVGGLGLGNARVDLTQNKLYTLTEGTRNILDRLNPDKPVTIRYYETTDDRIMPPQLKMRATVVRDLLLEFQTAAKGKLILERLNPNPNTEDEDRAREDDIQGLPVNQDGDMLYFGMAIQSAANKEVLPFLSPEQETSLEYNITRAIQKVSQTSKTVIGVMTSMPIMGSPMFPFQQQQRSQQPWILIQRLRMDYEVRDVPMSSDKIDSDINTLVVIHPADITETAEYAIDQYLLKGGKVIALVDPQSIVAKRVYSNQPNPMTGQPGGVINPASDLANLFKAWGVSFTKNQVVADVNYRSPQGGQNPLDLELPAEALDQTDRMTSNLQPLRMLVSGAFTIDPRDGIQSTILASSSKANELLDVSEAESLTPERMNTFSATGRPQILAVRLSGKFKTAFPGGRPKGPAASPESGGAQEDATAPKPADAAAPAPAPAPAPTAAAAPATPAPVPVAPVTAPATPVVSAPAAPKAEAPAAPKAAAKKEEFNISDGTIKESVSNEGVVVLFGDADMMYDELCVGRDRITGEMVAANANLPLMLNAIEVLSGGGDLLQVRGRAATQRPFLKMAELREKVDQKYRPQRQGLQAKLDETAQKMGPLRVKDGQLADPRQIKELNELMKTQSDINRQIREVKREQNKEIEFTKSMIILLNFLAVPLLVISLGLLLAMRRRAVTAAV
ncbi:MAG: Gldg family protein [Verrucomicrobiota bacterium]